MVRSWTIKRTSSYSYYSWKKKHGYVTERTRQKQIWIQIKKVKVAPIRNMTSKWSEMVLPHAMLTSNAPMELKVEKDAHVMHHVNSLTSAFSLYIILFFFFLFWHGKRASRLASKTCTVWSMELITRMNRRVRALSSACESCKGCF